MIGRVEPAGLIIPDTEVSRRHARLNCREGGYFLEDLGSSNGTLINGERIKGERSLKDGDEIRLGSRVILDGMSDDRSSPTNLAQHYAEVCSHLAGPPVSSR